ncbi:hypothetical protein [Mammaliicoccus sciuri]|nr:hypothetical protein [Mammaliicoccus sciuri]
MLEFSERYLLKQNKTQHKNVVSRNKNKFNFECEFLETSFDI